MRGPGGVHFGAYNLGSARIRRFSRGALTVNLQVIGMFFDAAGVVTRRLSSEFDSPYPPLLEPFSESAGHFARKLQSEEESCLAPAS